MLDSARRKFLIGLLTGFVGGTVTGAGSFRLWTALGGSGEVFRDVVEKVAPRDGFETGIVFGNALQNIISAGVLVP